MRIEFFIPFKPRAKQSVKFTKLGRKYTPKDVKENALSLASLIAPHRPDTPLQGPLRAVYTVHYPWRTSDSQRRRAKGPRAKDTKPDCENILKQLNDVFEDSGFFVNDAQIAEQAVSKVYDGTVGVDVMIEQMDEG